MDADPFFVGEDDIDSARKLVSQAKDAELFLYPGDQHYYADNSLRSYDPDVTALLAQRVLDFPAPGSTPGLRGLPLPTIAKGRLGG